MTRWKWGGGPLEPTEDMTRCLAEADIEWWLEPDLFSHWGHALVVTPSGGKADPLRVLPGATLVLENGRPRVEQADQAEAATPVALDHGDDRHVDAIAGCAQFNPQWGPPRRTGGTGYLQFTDISGSKVQVLPSAVSARHCVRIYVEPPPERATPRPTKSGFVYPGERPFSMLLCRGMARELANALDQMLAEPVADELACEYTTSPPDGTTYVIMSKLYGDWRARCACGRVLSGGKHVQGPIHVITGGEMLASLGLDPSDPSNHDAIQHFATCEPHANQPPNRRTVTGVLR